MSDYLILSNLTKVYASPKGPATIVKDLLACRRRFVSGCQLTKSSQFSEPCSVIGWRAGWG